MPECSDKSRLRDQMWNEAPAGALSHLAPPERHLREPMRFRVTVFILTTVLVCLTHLALAAPIQQIQGVIVELEEGYLWLKPDGEAAPRKFLLRWKARFNPPKLPLKGDRVLILYKDKEEGSVIYGVDYLTTAPEPAQPMKDQVPDKGE
jgi:hypothetical protein